MRKIGELKTNTTTLVIYKNDEARCNPYRIYRKWYEGGWHRELLEQYEDLASCTFYISDYVMKKG